MKTQTKQILSFSDILQHLLGKEIYICTVNDYNLPMVMQGGLTSFDSQGLLLSKENSSLIVPYNWIDSINLVNHDDEVVNIETDALSDVDNAFYPYLNQHVECQASWWRAGIITYVGTDYVTIHIDGDKDCSYLPTAQIFEMATR